MNKSDFIHSSAWRHIRAQVIAHESVCYLCGKPVDKSLKTGLMAPSVDHIIARNSGGDLSNTGNLHLVHRGCNSKKSDMTLEEYRYRQSSQRQSSRDWGNI